MKKLITKKQSEDISSAIKKTLGEETKLTIYSQRSFPKDTPEFVMLFQAAGRNLFKILTPGACKILGYMFSMMQYGNHIGTDQKTFSEELNLSLRTVNGAISELKKLNVIISYQDPQCRKRNVYMINGQAAWKGEARKRKAHLKQFDKNQLEMFTTTNDGLDSQAGENGLKRLKTL